MVFIKDFLGSIIIVILGFIVGILFMFLSVIGGALIITAVAFFAIIFLYLRMPELARQAWIAEDKNGILLMLHGDDMRMIPVAAEYHKDTNVVRPVAKLSKLQFIPDPESTIPVHGHKSKLAFAYINYPYLIKPRHILIAYDLKRYGLENLGQALDYQEYFDRLDEYKKKYAELKEFVEELKKHPSIKTLPENLRQMLPEEIQSDEDYLAYRESLEKYVEDMEHTIELLEKQKAKEPIIRIGTRFYTIRDAIGYLAIYANPSRFIALKDAMENEARARYGSTFKEIMKYSLIIFAIGAVLVMVILALSWAGGHATPPPAPQPLQVPLVHTITPNTTTPMPG